MRKRWFVIRRPYMVRPVLYQIVSRAAIALTALLLWDRQVVSAGQTGFRVLPDGCLAAGIIFLCLSWFAYLRLDGVNPRFFGKKPDTKKIPRLTGDPADFADERIVPFSELTGEEQAACLLAANLACAALYLAPALVWSVFF